MNPVRAAADRLFTLGGARVTHRIGRSSDGGIVHYIEAGIGQPLVLLHGGGGGSANWFRLIAPLARRFRVLAPDLPGFGESTPVRATAPLAVQAAGFLRAWLESAAPPPWTLVGTSFGALAAFRLAQAEPAHVRRIVLIDPVGFGAGVAFVVRLAALPALRRLLARPSRSGSRVVFDTLLTGGRASIPAALRAALLDYLWECDVAGAAAQVQGNLAHFTGLFGQREVISSDELRAFRIPCLFLWGARDRFVPSAHGRRAADLMSDARLHVIPDAGHSPNWETPDEVLAALDAFLAGPSRTA